MSTVEKYRDIETWVRSHLKSFEMTPFDTFLSGLFQIEILKRLSEMKLPLYNNNEDIKECRYVY